MEYYEINYEFRVLTEQIFEQKINHDLTFWDDATKYASISKDEAFVEEVAYMMVTLHRTGA